MNEFGLSYSHDDIEGPVASATFRRVHNWQLGIKLPNLLLFRRACLEFADIRGFVRSDLMSKGLEDLARMIPKWQLRGPIGWLMRLLRIPVTPQLKATSYIDRRFLSGIYLAMYGRKSKKPLGGLQ